MNKYIPYQTDSDYSSEEYVSIDDLILNQKPLNSGFISAYDSSSDSELIPLNQVIQTIKKNPCVILYSSWCGYSRKALDLLKQAKRSAKKIEIEDIQGSMNEIRNQLSKAGVGFPKSYSSRPMIFMNGKFIGGYDQLSKMI
jgi:glutaredoxin-related protein